MAVFDEVRYSLCPSLSPTRKVELAAVLDLNGASSHPPYTHLIALPASHAHTNAINDPAVKPVTDRWVDRSVIMGKRQPEQYYSPDPAMIFSGVVACATDLSATDLEVLSAGITALGGQWRMGLTRDVTHLFALRTGSDKYNTALHFAPQTHMCILTPHWFDDAVRLGRRIPETPYAWPDPLVLRAGITLNLNDDILTTEGRRRRKSTRDTEAEDNTNSPSEGEHVRVWEGRRILLSTSLQLGDSSRSAIEAGIQRAGGVVVLITEDADEDVEEKAVDECDVLITRWRSGKSYFKATRASLLIGTLSWLFSVESSGTLRSPLDSLLWYPTPSGGIPGLVDCEISITNYTGAARDYIKRLIGLIGAKFTPSMSQTNKVLVAGFQPSPKTDRALSWSIPVVNHTWLEDCFVEWRALTVGLERYIVYPPGIDFGKMLMTRHDGPPSSQSASIPRLTGGAVPGGRGIGIIDVEEEELRDAEYRARARTSGDAPDLSTTHEANAKDTTVDEMSTVLLEGDVPTASRVASVKKPPSSSGRAKRGSMSAPTMLSATGAFIDHVIELPADNDEQEERVGGRRPTPANGKQHTRPSLSAGVVQVAARDVGGSSRDGKGTGRGRRGSEVHIVEAEIEVKKRSSVQTKKPQRRLAKGMAFDSGSQSDAGGDEPSEPPRRAIGAGSMTPVKSGMKPRPRSKSKSGHNSALGGESGDEMRIMAAESGVDTGKQREVAKPTRNGEVVTKEKEKEKTRDGKKETEKGVPHPRPSTRSPMPTSLDTKNRRTPEQPASVYVPSMPTDPLSSPSAHHGIEADRVRKSGQKSVNGATASEPKRKQLAPEASIRVVAAEASTSTSKRGRPSHGKTSTNPTTPGKSRPQPLEVQVKSKPGVSKGTTKARVDDDHEDMDGDNDMSMVVDTPMTSTSRGGPRRGAANKATTRLREEVMPDVMTFEKEQKQAKRRRSMGGESVASVRREDDERVERGGKKRKVAMREEEEEEEAEVEDVVLVPSGKSGRKSMNGKSKTTATTDVDSDGDMDDHVKSKSGVVQEKKGARVRGKDLAAIRLMTTGVILLDDVIKRLTKLGVQMTTRPTDCTHLVAKGIVRTEKFLRAMSVSPYILTEEWANASAKGGKLLPENEYLLSDATAEQKWAFKFADATARAKGPGGGSNLFAQMTFYVTPKVSIDTKLLKNVVSAGGGQVQTSTTPTARILRGKANRYVVSCREDKAIWRSLVQEGFKIYSPELILRAALKQEIEWEREECLVAR